jgi:hypothetical protein
MSDMVESSLSAVGRRLYDRLRPRWALVGRKRGNTAKSAIRPKGKLRIVLLTAGGLASHLSGRLVFSQPDVNRVPQ